MERILKKPACIILGILLLASTVQGEDAKQDAERLRVQTRNMIAAGVPGDKAEKMLQMMASHNFSHRNMVRAQQLVIDCEKKGLPSSQVMNKAFEGMAKNAPDEAIVNAMEATHSRYSYAHRHAKQITNDERQVEEISEAIAGGLKAGVNKKDADKIMAAVRQRTRDMDQKQVEELAEESLKAARTMARFGVPSDAVAGVTCNALRNNYSAKNMRQLQTRFKTQAMKNSTSAVANQYAHAISKGAAAGHLGSSSQNKGSNKGSAGHGGGSSGAGNSSGSGSGGAGSGSGGSGGSGSGGGAGGSGSGGGSGGGGSGGSGGSGSGGSGSGSQR